MSNIRNLAASEGDLAISISSQADEDIRRKKKSNTIVVEGLPAGHKQLDRQIGSHLDEDIRRKKKSKAYVLERSSTYSAASERDSGSKISSQPVEGIRRDKKPKANVIKRLSGLFSRHSKINDSSSTTNVPNDSDDDSAVSYSNESDNSPPRNETTKAPHTHHIPAQGTMMKMNPHDLIRTHVQRDRAPSIPYEKIWTTILKHFSKGILLEVLSDNKLPAKSELVVVEVLSRWLKLKNENNTPCRETTELLQCIRWSAVESTFIEALREKPSCAESREFLNKVLEYRESNNQFQGLKTLLRPATGEELFLVFITLTEEGNSFNNKFYKANLRKSNCFKLMRTQLQVLTQPNLTASVKDNMLYVTGVGRYCKEVWRYGDCEWVQCGKLVEGRRGHCQAIVNSCIYICGGNSVKNKNDVLNCIEKYDTNGHKSTKVDCQLQHAVDYSACLAYKGSVYLFGGKNNDQKNVDYVQMFNPSENTCAVISNMPDEYQLMKAVLWENQAILLGRYNCFIYEFETRVWMRKTQLKTNVHHFGLVLENQQIYIFGGGREKSEGDWKLTNKIKYVDVDSITKKDYELEWKDFGCLPSPCMIDICGSLRLPIKHSDISHSLQFPGLLFSESVIQHIPDDCMKKILDDDSLQVANELEVCELLLMYLRVCLRSRKTIKNPSLLTAIRWSAVDKPYAELNIFSNELFTLILRGSNDYITKLSDYYATGNKFEGLKTFLRPSIKLERFMVVVGIHAGENLTSDVFRINLQKTDGTYKKLPSFQSSVDSVACVKDNILYVIGVGDMENQIWKYEHGVGWSKCTRMIQGRSRHFVAVINSDIFICGGRSCQEHDDDDGVTLNHVERYNIARNKSEQEHTRLVRAVENATCVVFNMIIYIFGGGDKSNDRLSLVQAFDPKSNSSYFLKTCLPRPQSLIKSVMWDNSVVLLGKVTCIVYNFETDTMLDLRNYGTGVDYFGLVLENGTLFIFGGRLDHYSNTGAVAHEINSSNAEMNLTDQVRCISIHSILNKEPTSWALYNRMSMAGCVYACAALTLPVTDSKQKKIRQASSIHTEKTVLRNESRSTIDAHEDMTCSICFNIYKDPRVLPCGHSFCLECLESMDFIYKTTSCPLCGIPCKKEKKDFKQLPKNYALGNMSDKIRQSEREPEIIAVNRESGKFTNSSRQISFPPYEMVHLSTLKSEEGKRITGVTVLGGNIYLISTMSKEIEVYSIKSYQRVNTIQVERLKSPKDISSFKSFENSLFIIDSIDHSCCFLEYSLSKKIISKLVDNIHDPFTLSFTPNGDVLLLHEYKDWCWRIDLYNPVQKSARNVLLPSKIKFPKHAIQTNAGHFVICYGTGELQEDRSWSRWAISLVSDMGKILKTLPPTDGGPFYYLALGSNDNEMFVSDGRAVQVIKLDRDLTEAKLLANDCVRASHWKPWKICSCEVSKKWLLVVGHSTGFIDIFVLGTNT